MHLSLDLQVDMIEAYGELQFNLDFYTDGGDLTRLADVINDVRDVFTTSVG